MQIFHISDSHISSSSHFNKESFDHAFKEYSEGAFDLLIHSGDITQSGQRSEYVKAVEKFDKNSWPDILVPGNHDKRSGGISLFEKYIGESSGVELSDNSLVVYVDSGVADKNEGRVGTVKYNMIKDALNKYQMKDVKILVLHHHVIPIPMAGRERNVLANAGDLLEMILRFDVDLVLMGHRHFPNVYKIENTVFVNAGTLSDKKTRHGDVNSYNIISIDEDEIKVNIKRTDDSHLDYSFSRKEKHIFNNFGEKKCRIIQMSNSFISHSDKFLRTHFNKAVDTINSSDADILIHCGGIVEEGIRRNYELAGQLFSRIKIPKLITPAGRDINYLGYRLFPYFFGDFDITHVIDHIIFQGISSSQYDSSIGIIGQTERTELLKQFDEHPNKLKCLFLHHNVIPIPHSREKGLLEDSGDLLYDLVDKKVDLILTGTSSHPLAVKINDTIIVNVNSLSSVYTRSVGGNSFNMIDIYDNMVVVYEINSLWNTRKIIGMWNIDMN